MGLCRRRPRDSHPVPLGFCPPDHLAAPTPEEGEQIRRVGLMGRSGLKPSFSPKWDLSSFDSQTPSPLIAVHVGKVEGGGRVEGWVRIPSSRPSVMTWVYVPLVLQEEIPRGSRTPS